LQSNEIFLLFEIKIEIVLDDLKLFGSRHPTSYLGKIVLFSQQNEKNLILKERKTKNRY
jgi:hypothetical protein